VTFIGYIDYTTESNPRPFYVGIGVEKRTQTETLVSIAKLLGIQGFLAV